MRLLALLPLFSPLVAAGIFGSWTGHGGDKENAKPAIEETMVQEDKVEWQLKGLTRYPDQSANKTTWQCTIVEPSTADSHETACEFSVPSSDPVASFYGIPCGGGGTGSGFAVSWGYNKEADSAVVSVCFAPNGTVAWFGYEQVSHKQLLGDSRKEPVYHSGCA